MKYYKEINTEGFETYNVWDENYDLQQIVNEYLNDRCVHLSLNFCFVKVKILCNYFNFLKSNEIDPLLITTKDLSDYLIYIRCPDGIKLNSKNFSVTSESEVMKHICAISHFYTNSYILDDYAYTHLEDLWGYINTEARINEQVNYLNKLFNEHKSTDLKMQLDKLSENLLKRVRIIQYSEYIDKKQIELLYENCADSFESLLLKLELELGFNSQLLEHFPCLDNLFIMRDNFIVIHYAPNYQVYLDDILSKYIAKYRNQIKNLTKKQLNKIIKGISERSGVKFTESALLKTYFINHYSHENGCIVCMSYATNSTIGHIFKTILKHLNNDISVYHRLSDSFNLIYKRNFFMDIDGRVSAYHLSENEGDTLEYLISRHESLKEDQE